MSLQEAIHGLELKSENTSLHDLDWKDEVYEWDTTDIGLSTEAGLQWLRQLGVLSDETEFQDLNEAQQDAVRSLLDKIEKKNISEDQLLSGEHDHHKVFASDIERIVKLMSEPGIAPSDTFSETSSVSARRRITPRVLRSATERLAIAWSHRQDAHQVVHQTDRELRQLLMLSRARLQAELVALRRENAALRQGLAPNDAIEKIDAEKQLTSVMQQLLDERDSQVASLTKQLQAQTEELAVLRSMKDLAMDGQTPGQRRRSSHDGLGFRNKRESVADHLRRRSQVDTLLREHNYRRTSSLDQ